MRRIPMAVLFALAMIFAARLPRASKTSRPLGFEPENK